MRQNEAQAVADSIMRGGEATGQMYANVGHSLGQGIGKGFENKRYSEEQAESKRRFDEQQKLDAARNKIMSEEAEAKITEAKNANDYRNKMLALEAGKDQDTKTAAAKQNAKAQAKEILKQAYASGDQDAINRAIYGLQQTSGQKGSLLSPQDLAGITNEAVTEFLQGQTVIQLARQQTEPYQESKRLLERTQLVNRAAAELQDLAKEYERIGAIEGADSAKAREIEAKYINLMRDLKAGGVAEDLGVKVGGPGGMFTTKREYMQ
jgi:hypothetical protein